MNKELLKYDAIDKARELLGLTTYNIQIIAHEICKSKGLETKASKYSMYKIISDFTGIDITYGTEPKKKNNKPKRKNTGKLSKKRKKGNKKKANFYNSKEWKALRYKAFIWHGRQCLCCGAKPPEVVLHVDHIIPRSIRPDLELNITNLQILCETCNLGKSNKDDTDFRVTKEEPIV